MFQHRLATSRYISRQTLSMAAQPLNQADPPDGNPDLWKEAYQALYLEKPKLVIAYQNLVLEDDVADVSPKETKADDVGMTEADATAIEAHLRLDKEQISRFLSKKVEAAQDQAKLHLKISKSKEVTIDVGEQVDRIVKGITCAKDFIGSIVSNEPHAALAWAGVCVILPFILNAHEQSTAALDGFEYISNLMLQYLVREQTYRGLKADEIDRPGGVNVANLKGQFESKTVKLYTRITEYQIRLSRQYSRHRLFRYMRNVAKCDGWNAMLDEIKKFEAQGGGDVAAIDSIRLKFLALGQKRHFEALEERLKINQKEMKEMVERIEAKRIAEQKERDEKIRIKAQDEEVSKCLSTIIKAEPEIPKPVDHKGKLENKKGKVLPETCGWLHSHPTYTALVDSDSNDLLWIHGKPGKGKSMLALSLIDKLTPTAALTKNSGDADATDMPTTVCCHFFFAHDDYRVGTAVALMRSMLYQLLESHPDLVVNIMKDLEIKREELFTQPEALQACWRILMDMIRSSPATGSSYFIVDALDECDSESRAAWLKHLVENVRPGKQRQPQHKMKWIITSRSNELDISEAFGNDSGFKSICLEDNAAAIEEDVFRYIEAQKKTFPKRHSEAEKAAIGRTLLENSEGTFLWVWLACEQIRKARPGLVDAMLKKPVKGLDDFYQRMLDSIDEDAQEIARDILQVVLYAARPFGLRELATASEVAGPNEDEICEDTILSYLELCGSFVDIERTTGTVTLIHQSARTFLRQNMKTERSKSIYATYWQPEEGHLVLAGRCYSYLHCGALAACKPEKTAHSSIEGEFSTALEAVRYPFLAYAVAFWMHHARLASHKGNKNNTSRVTDIFDRDTEFLKPGESATRRRWCEKYAFSYLNWGRESYTALQVACRGGIVPLVTLLLDRGDAIDAADRAGNTPFHHAAWEGHDDVVTILLERGAKKDSKDEDDRTALHLVACRNRESTIELLLSHGVDDVLLRAAEKKYGKTPLHCAVDALHEGVARILIKRMASVSLSVDPRDREGHTPLHYAACWGYWNLRRFQGRPKGRGGGCSAGAFSVASVRAIDILRPTAAQDDEEDTKDRCYDRFVCLLMENGADVEAVNSFGYSTLHLAVFEKQEGAIRLLLERGKCNPSPRDRIGWTPLMWAVDESWITIAQLLLDFKADVSVSDEDGQTALHLAAMEMNVDMIRLLLQFGADACAVDKKGATPLYLSCQNGPLEAASLLIQNATNLNLPVYESMDTPLLIAIDRQTLAAELLIEAGCDLKLANKNGVTPLHMAAWEGTEAIARKLLSLGADMSLRTVADNSIPLQLAVYKESYPVAKLLIDWGSDLHVLDKRGGTLLHIAANKGPPETVQMLLEKGLDPVAKDNYDATPLHEATLLGSVAVAALLLEAGADANAICEEYGGTALDMVREVVQNEEKRQQTDKWVREEEKQWLRKHQVLMEYLQRVTGIL
ncbi:uncharacterized protein PAC_02433 [Phialocephala subalpina]|uniref:Uncharacterized protein n=1 Tax=Phialocephala subalpina TaxID=576137 RepID=A0A1L7WIG4_9HELO|nr:uncharacterized protein PAC_02433 [Phialocephala subalpina]